MTDNSLRGYRNTPWHFKPRPFTKSLMNQLAQSSMSKHWQTTICYCQSFEQTLTATDNNFILESSSEWSYMIRKISSLKAIMMSIESDNLPPSNLIGLIISFDSAKPYVLCDKLWNHHSYFANSMIVVILADPSKWTCSSTCHNRNFQ